MPDRRAAIAALLETFDEARGVTLSVLEIGDAALAVTLPRPGLDTIGKHLREMLAIEEAYVDALASGTVDLSRVPDVFSFEPMDAETFKTRGEELSARRHELLESDAIKDTCTWDGYDVDSASVIATMTAHEAHHQGQIAAFLYVRKARIPDELAAYWSLPQPGDD